MPKYPFKKMTSTQALKVGHFLVEFATPGIGHILKSAGCEFVVLDTEHTGYSFETVRNMVQFTRAANLPMIVRVPSKDYHHIARALDVGAQGIMLPMVDTADEAHHILQCINYPPIGLRGAMFQFAHDNYQPGQPLEKMREANKSITLFAQIESAKGVENAGEIAAINGVDCLWIGHFDLSNSLGIPGQFDHPEFIAATDTVLKAAHKHGKSVGRVIPTVADCIALYKQGYDFISFSGDVWAYHAAVSSAVTEIRTSCASLSQRRSSTIKKRAKKRAPKIKTDRSG